MFKIDSVYLKELDDKAFRLLPHLYSYNQQRQQVGQNIIDPNEYSGRTYEDFRWELDLHLDNEDEKSLIGLERDLERIEKGINLVSDVSQFSEPDWIVEGLVIRNGLTFLYGDSGILNPTGILRDSIGPVRNSL